MYLSEVINKERFQKGKLNLVVAKTGQGKTTMAAKTLPEQLKIENKQRILFLIDTNMGKSNLLKEKYFQNWEEKNNKIYVMNYHMFGCLLIGNEIAAEMFDLIIADEFHNLYKYARIDEAKMYKACPSFNPATIAMMLSNESSSYCAMEALKRWSLIADCYIVAMTATPQQFLEKDKELTEYIHLIKQNEELIVYKTISKYTYGDIKPLLQQNVEEKRAIFAPTIDLCRRFKKEIEESTGRNVVALWSSSNFNNPLSSTQMRTSSYLINNKAYPPEVDDIVFTEAYTTSWDLTDPQVKTMICHTSNEVVAEQFRGRARKDIDNFYIHSNEKVEQEKKKEKRKIIGNFSPPEKYLNKKLSSQEKVQLLQEINYPKNWQSYIKWLKENSFSTEVKKIKGERYTILRPIDATTPGRMVPPDIF